MNQNSCSINKCKEIPIITYLNKPLCTKHWETLSSQPINNMKNTLNIKNRNKENNEEIKEEIKEETNKTNEINETNDNETNKTAL